MRIHADRLEEIFAKTGGECTYCEKQLAWGNYGRVGFRAAWQVDHSLPVSRGGTDHLNNLVPACVTCNRVKGDMTGVEFRRTLVATSQSEGADWDKVLLAGAGLFLLNAWLKGRQNQGPPQQNRGMPPEWP